MSADDGEAAFQVEGEDQQLRVKQWDASEPLRNLCKYNRITRQKYVQSADLYEQLEVFQEMIFELSSATFFPNLVELWIMDQAYTVKNLHGLDACSKLRVLNVTQCGIRSAEGLEKLTGLRKLVLHTNAIESLEPLRSLVNLEELNVHSNKLQSLEGVETMAHLRHLEAGRNPLQLLDPVLTLQRLRILNVAGTKIGSFYEILKLNALPKLEDLYFGDPHFGSCPVCYLCNYQTYVLYHLPQLQRLDSIPLTEEAKKGAQNTYLKKRMYYNMRIKTVRRDGMNVVLHGHRIVDAFVKDLHRHTVVLHKNLQFVKRSLAESPPDSDTSELSVLSENLAEQLTAWRNHVRSFDALVTELAREVKIETEDMITRLMLELETGGNIRLEDGSSRDVWFKSCSDLLNSRFNPNHFREKGAPQVAMLRVNRVSRIHNRLLRNAFEMRLNELTKKISHAERLTRTKAGVKHASKNATTPIEVLADLDIDFSSMEYLFFDSAFGIDSLNPNKCGEDMICLVQAGIGSSGPAGGRSDSSTASFASGHKQRLAFVNDVATVENRWLKLRAERAKRSRPANSVVASAQLPHANDFQPTLEGEIVICKVFLGSCQERGAATNPNREAAKAEIPVTYVENCKFEESRNSAEVAAAAEGYDRARRWIVEDSALALPEYIVQYELVQPEQPDGHQRTRSTGSEFASRLAATSTFEKPTVPSDGIAEPFQRLLQLFLEKCERFHSLLLNTECLSGERVLDRVAESIPAAAEAAAHDPDLNKPRYVLIDLDGRRDGTDGSPPTSNSAYPVSPDEILAILGAPGIQPSSPAASSTANKGTTQTSDTKPDSARSDSSESKSTTPEETKGESQVQAQPAEESAPSAASTPLHNLELAFLNGAGLKGLPIFDFAPSLTKLDLSFNKLRQLPDGVFAPLTRLQDLNLDFNYLSTLDVESQGFQSLATLSLVCNRVSAMAEVTRLHHGCPQLLALNMADNPICKLRGYVGGVIRRLPQIAVLDGCAIDSKGAHRDQGAKIQRLIQELGVTKSSEEAIVAKPGSRVGTSTFVLRSVRVPYGESHVSGRSDQLQDSASGVDSTTEGRTSAEARAEAEASALIEQELGTTGESPERSTEVYSSPPTPTGKLAAFYQQVVELDLSSQGFSSIQCMHHLPNLQVLNLAMNEIETISGLERCIYLRDLNLSFNCIERIQGLDRNPHLKKLDVSGNLIASFEGVGSLLELEQLSMQDNRVDCLDHLGSLESLVELYVANNAIDSLRELQKLKQLSKLIILDLVGNPAVVNSAADQYRPYSIFHLPQLKVLDGQGITSAEYYAAKDKFAGKVTVDFLAEIIGHEDFQSIYELDLNGCRIRMLESFRDHRLFNLVDLDLSNNALTSIEGLFGLEQLTVLRLGKNKLSTPAIANVSAQATTARAAAAKHLTGVEGGFTEMRLCSLEV